MKEIRAIIRPQKLPRLREVLRAVPGFPGMTISKALGCGATVRLAGSSGANPFACIAAGIACLWGPSHGGANEAVLKMLDEIGSVENVPAFMEGVKAKTHKLMGFGHRVYKNFDPRAKIMKETCPMKPRRRTSPAA